MLSVIICTHNPRPDYLARCLTALELQSLPREEWELILIDNASVPGKEPRSDLSWHPRSRVIHEAKLGLTPARLRGIREAIGVLLVYVDDDNVLDANFLETTLRIAETKPFLGAWSGQCHPEFEQTPPDWTRRYWGNLSIRQFDQDVWSNIPRLPASMPCGAGLSVRREVAQRYLYLNDSGRRRFQFDRTGDSLVSGGDNDFAACACDLGLGVGIIASLILTHIIPPERLTADYLTRLAEGIHFSSTLLDAQHGIQPIPRGLLGVSADFLRAIRLKQPHRRILKAAYRGREHALKLLASKIDGIPKDA